HNCTAREVWIEDRKAVTYWPTEGPVDENERYPDSTAYRVIHLSEGDCQVLPEMLHLKPNELNQFRLTVSEKLADRIRAVLREIQSPKLSARSHDERGE